MWDSSYDSPTFPHGDGLALAVATGRRAVPAIIEKVEDVRTSAIGIPDDIRSVVARAGSPPVENVERLICHLSSS